MIRKRIVLGISLLCFSILACKSKPYSKETKQFNQYLQEQFGLSLKDNKQTYILIAKNGCMGCMQKYLMYISQSVNAENIKHLIFISSNNIIVPEELANKVKIYQDNKGELDRLLIDVVNVVLVETENKRIDTIRHLQLCDTLKIRGYLK